jgi:hypothetical protein
MGGHAQSYCRVERLGFLGGSNREHDSADDCDGDGDQDDRDPEATAPPIIRRRRRSVHAG